MKLPFALVLFGTSMALPLSAHAAPDAPSEEETTTEHVSFSMAFLGSARDYRTAPFDMVGGAGGTLLGADPRRPFQQAPFDRLPVFGLRYDTRLVVSGVRMTAGFDLPFASAAATQVGLAGVERTVTLAQLRPYELRFGIGYEAPTKKLVPFLDLLGGVHWTTATLLVDGQPASYSATSFATSLRGGLRLELRKGFFVAAAGELGLRGDVRYGGELSVGFRSF